MQDDTRGHWWHDCNAALVELDLLVMWQQRTKKGQYLQTNKHRARTVIPSSREHFTWTEVLQHLATRTQEFTPEKGITVKNKLFCMIANIQVALLGCKKKQKTNPINGICAWRNNMLCKSIRDQGNEIETAWAIKLESVRQIFNLMCRWIWALSIFYAQHSQPSWDTLGPTHVPLGACLHNMDAVAVRSLQHCSWKQHFSPLNE